MEISKAIESILIMGVLAPALVIVPALMGASEARNETPAKRQAAPQARSPKPQNPSGGGNVPRPERRRAVPRQPNTAGGNTPATRAPQKPAAGGYPGAGTRNYAASANTTPVFGYVPAPSFGNTQAPQYPNQPGTINPPKNGPTPQYPNGPKSSPGPAANNHGPNPPSPGPSPWNQTGGRRVCCAFPANVTPVHGAGGSTSYTHPDGRHWDLNQQGQISHFSEPGMEARFAGNGKLNFASVTRPDDSQMTIHRPIHGERVIEVVHPDHSRLVVLGGNRGYLERPLARPGYIARTYVVAGRPYATVYRTYSYRHMVYYRYLPAVYYHPVFYAWAVDPWPAPAVYRWGWQTAPWWRVYGTYLAPPPAYASAALWLTDFVLAENLRLAYENARASAAPAPSYAASPQRALTPEVKQTIAEQIRRQIEAERDGAAQSASPSSQQAALNSDDAAPPALDANQRIFVVSMNLDVNTVAGPCALTPGDIILRTGDAPAAGTTVSVNVLNSQSGDCPVNTAAQVELSTLQEMHNQFREQIDHGLKTLAENGGKDGLPYGPAADPRVAPEGRAMPDPIASGALAKQRLDADQAEVEIRKQIHN
jgi:hypothetical protein